MLAGDPADYVGVNSKVVRRKVLDDNEVYHGNDGKLQEQGFLVTNPVCSDLPF